jgi:hypothetical protein
MKEIAMQIAMTQFDLMTDEKSRYVEDKANELFRFVLESRKQLASEALTTINWLFLVMIGSFGFLPKLLDMTSPVKWWLIAPLIVGACYSGIVAARLFCRAMRFPQVLPPGNDPKNLLTDDFMEYDMAWMRAAETASMQERIDAARAHNVCVADATTDARWCLVALPFVEITVGLIAYSFTGA